MALRGSFGQGGVPQQSFSGGSQLLCSTMVLAIVTFALVDGRSDAISPTSSKFKTQYLKKIVKEKLLCNILHGHDLLGDFRPRYSIKHLFMKQMHGK